MSPRRTLRTIVSGRRLGSPPCLLLVRGDVLGQLALAKLSDTTPHSSHQGQLTSSSACLAVVSSPWAAWIVNTCWKPVSLRTLRSHQPSFAAPSRLVLWCVGANLFLILPRERASFASPVAPSMAGLKSSVSASSAAYALDQHMTNHYPRHFAIPRRELEGV